MSILCQSGISTSEYVTSFESRAFGIFMVLWLLQDEHRNLVLWLLQDGMLYRQSSNIKFILYYSQPRIVVIILGVGSVELREIANTADTI